MTNKEAQDTQILNYLLKGKTITMYEAFEMFKIGRLAARVHDLIYKKHIPVQSKLVTRNKKRFAEYYLTPEYINQVKSGNS